MGSRSFRESTASATSRTVLSVASDERDGSLAVGGEIAELPLAICANAACGWCRRERTRVTGALSHPQDHTNVN